MVKVYYCRVSNLKVNLFESEEKPTPHGSSSCVLKAFLSMRKIIKIEPSTSLMTFVLLSSELGSFVCKMNRVQRENAICSSKQESKSLGGMHGCCSCMSYVSFLDSKISFFFVSKLWIALTCCICPIPLPSGIHVIYSFLVPAPKEAAEMCHPFTVTKQQLSSCNFLKSADWQFELSLTRVMTEVCGRLLPCWYMYSNYIQKRAADLSLI